MKGGSYWWVTLTAGFSLLLTRLPTLIPNGGAVAGLLAISPLLLCIAWGIPRINPGRIDHRLAILLGAFVVLLWVALVRGALQGVYGTVTSAAVEGLTFTTLAGFGLILFATARNDAETRQRLVACALAPGVYLLANVALRLVGVESAAIYDPSRASVALNQPAQILGLLGIGGLRVQFPLANSINNFGVVAATGLAASVVLWFQVRDVSRMMLVPVGAACLAGLLLGDSRGSFVIAVVVTIAALVTYRIFRFAWAIALLIPMSPLIVIAVLKLMAGASSLLSRNPGDLASASGRVFIWQGAERAIEFLSLESLIGFGAGGQITSGASINYAYMFPPAIGASAPAHNVALQMLFDLGYVGLGLFVLLTAMIMRRLYWASRDLGGSATALLVALIVPLLAGFTEVTPSFYAQETLVCFLLIAAAASGIAPASARVTVEQRQRPTGASWKMRTSTM
jgi:O-antigen ligase